MFVYVMILLLSLLFSGFANDYSSEKVLELDAESISTLRINAGAGFLKVYGKADQSRITVSAEIFVRNMPSDNIDEFLEKNLRLQLERRGSKAILYSEYDQSGWEKIFGRRPEVVVDLTVVVPENIDLDIDDGSGMILIENIDGEVDLDDGSGETTIKGITGDVHVDDGSGDLNLREIGGDVDIDDGSGELHLTDIRGNVDIDDGSGVITIDQVGGNVRVEDGSGSINISNVEKDVIIGDDGSGSVNISGVKGQIVRRDK